MPILATAEQCPAPPVGLPPGWYYLLTLAVALGGIILLLWIANGYSSPSRRKAYAAGRLIELAGMSAALTGGVLISYFMHRDRCGHVVGTGTLGTWLLVAGLAGFAVGTLVRAATEWISFAVIAIADLWLLAILAWSQGAHRPAITVILGTHALCSCYAVAWSRRTRAAERAVKAKASEAGRQLAAAWLIFALLYLASQGYPDGSALPETTVLNVFVITAIVLITGSGYTKYTEAMAALGELKPPPDRLTNLRRLPTRLLRGQHRRRREIDRTHMAVIQHLPSSAPTVVAEGSEHHCTTALERWIEQHGLPEHARAFIARAVAETVVEPGVGVYTVPLVRH